ELAAKECEHIFGPEAEGGVAQELPVEGAQGGATGKQDVGRILGLMRGPVVAIALELIAQERVHAVGEAVEHARPVEGCQAIGESLHAAGILEPEEGILEPAVSRAALAHLAGEPLVAVDVDLHREGKPRLHPGVAEAELAVEEVEVEEEALAPRRPDRWAALAVGQPEAAAGRDGPEDTHEPV